MIHQILVEIIMVVAEDHYHAIRCHPFDLEHGKVRRGGGCQQQQEFETPGCPKVF